MEKYIICDLLDDETVLWCSKHEKEKERFSILSGKPEALAILFAREEMLAVVFGILGFMFLAAGASFNYWGTLLGAALVIGIFTYTRLADINKYSGLFYYVTDMRIITLRRNNKKRIVRTQFLGDINEVDIITKSEGRGSLFFAPAKCIDIYEIKKHKEDNRREIDMHVSMVFLSAFDVKELISILKTQKHINMEID